MNQVNYQRILQENLTSTGLYREFKKLYYRDLEDFLHEEERLGARIYPKRSQVFACLEYFRIQDTKVVIVGQDPYPQKGYAHGLCFSVPIKVPIIPRSLQNIFKELREDTGIPSFNNYPQHGDLTGWAEQGVLLLNSVLTVRSSEPDSHKGKGWEKFTDAVISWLNSHLDRVVFMLWGRLAQKKGANIDRVRHLVLEASHPSPLSARHFIGCGHFSLANCYLKRQGKTPIYWNRVQQSFCFM